MVKAQMYDMMQNGVCVVGVSGGTNAYIRLRTGQCYIYLDKISANHENIWENHRTHGMIKYAGYFS
jgi:hypothetical protein